MGVGAPVKLGDHTIVLLTRVPTGERGRYGDDVLRDVFTEVRWCLVTPAGSSEAEDQGTAKVTGLQLLAPPGTPVDAAAAVIWPPVATENPDEPFTGPRYEVDGDVGIWEESVQARLTKVG